MNKRPLAAALLAAGLLAAQVASAGGPPQPRRMFVTSATGSGDIGSWPEAGAATGVAAGDAICQSLAAAASLPNAGGYAAWLSDASADDYCHLLGWRGWVHDIYRWTSDGTAQCSGPYRIYCFGTTMVLLIDGFESGDLTRWAAP